jgi:peptide/nickel transport system substrate-binding protein
MTACTAVAWAVMYLFFEGFYLNILNYFEETVGKQNVQEEIVVVEPVYMAGLESTIFDPFTRQRLNNVYESLVRSDEDLNMKPCLAKSWGILDDLTWEFNLRKNVKFHDGSEFDAEDVVSSIDLVKDFLATIDKVEKVDDFTIQIKTKTPDPILISKLAMVYIGTDGIGTGPYKISKYNSKSGELDLEVFADYWGDKPLYKKAKFLTITDKNKRLKSLVDGTADILDYVPYDLAGKLDQEKFEIFAMPSLEVQFLGFNFKSELFKDLANRRTILNAIDKAEFAEFVGGEYVKPVDQFVSSGVFGYNPDIEVSDEDNCLEKDCLDQGMELNLADLLGKTVKIILPFGSNALGEYLTKSFDEIGIKTSIQYVKGEYFEKTLKKVKYDMYFVGFKSELGDAGDFLKSIEQLGFANYSNARFTELIEKQEVEMKPKERLKFLQEAMKILVSDDVFGVPLFEYETLVAAKKGIDFEPRIDGFIYLNDL